MARRPRLLPGKVALFGLAACALLGGCGRGDAGAPRAALEAQRNALAERAAAAPADAAVAADYAALLIRLGDGVAAEAAVRRAADAGGDSARLRPDLARAILAQGEAARALTELNAGPVHPDRAGDAGHVAGAAHLALGNLAAARTGFDVAARTRGNDSGLWVDIARFRRANADLAGAIDAVDYAAELDANNAAAAAVKAALVRTQAGLTAALPWHERALELAPDDAEILLDYAATLGDLGRYRAMLAAVRAAAKLAPRDPRIYFHQAVVAARAGNFTLARSLLQQTRGQMDGTPAFLLVSGIVELRLDGAVVAARKFEQVLKLQPDNFPVRRLAAAAAWADADYAGAAAMLAPIVARADADSWALELAARAAAASGGDAAAAAPALFARANRLNRGDAAPFAASDAYGLLAKAADRAPLDPAAVVPAMRAEIGRGDSARAAARARALLAPNRGVVEAQLLYGDAAFAGGDRRAATEAYRAATRLAMGETTALRLANVQQVDGDAAGAFATITALRAAQPRNLAAMRLAGHMAAATGRPAAALTLFEGVRRRIGDRDALVLAELAALAGPGRRGRGAPDALAFARRAYHLRPLNPDLTRAYARAAAAAGRSDIARDLDEKAAALASAAR